ncbi:NUDIX hydrolase [Streptomyces lavendulocolor]|uniref:NUDIX hydrolase n=1 Tax=Streptomyces lavendulocolor TaxID=67316 RepID=UPI0033C12F87
MTNFALQGTGVHATVVVAHDTDGCVAVLRARIPPSDSTHLLLPGGLPKPGETAEDCARRELREGTGVGAGEWRALGSHAISLGSPARLALFLAQDLSAGPYELTPAEEGYTVMWWSLQEAIEAAAEGRLLAGGSLALLLAERALRR